MPCIFFENTFIISPSKKRCALYHLDISISISFILKYFQPLTAHLAVTAAVDGREAAKAIIKELL
jgi:hypothetical protein